MTDFGGLEPSRALQQAKGGTVNYSMRRDETSYYPQESSPLDVPTTSMIAFERESVAIMEEV